MKNLLLAKVKAVLDHVTASDHPVPMKELQKALDLSPAVLSRIVSDLCELGLIDKAGYYTLIPGLGIFRFADSARRNSTLCKAAEKVLSPFSAQNDLNVLLTAAENQTIFTVFSIFLSPQSPKILWTSGGGVMMLASLPIQSDDALKYALAGNPQMSVEERVIFGQEFVSARSEGMLFRVRQQRQWTLSLPFSFRKTVCVLTVFGSVPERFDNMLFEVECRRLINRILANAKEFCHNAK